MRKSEAKLLKLVSFSLLVLFGLSLFSNMELDKNFIPQVYASPDMTPSDGDAWTENDNATYPWTETYSSDMSWSTTSKNGTYSLNATKTGHATRLYLFLALPSAVDVSSCDYLSFWSNASHTKAFRLYVYETATANSYYVEITPRTQWDLYIIRLESFSIYGSPSWSCIKKMWFKWGDLTSGSNETFLIDGLHFATYSQSSASNSISEALLPRFGYFMHNQTWEATSGYPDSLYAWKRTDTEAQSNGLETEALGQSIYAYCWAYNFSGLDFYLDMAETWANALYYFQNDTTGTTGYGGFAYGRAAGSSGQRTLVNAWIHIGLAYLYHLTSNATYKTMLDRSKIWLADTMWDSANSYFDHHYDPDADTIEDGGAFHWARDCAAAGALCAYSNYVEENSTLTCIADKCFNQMITSGTYRQFYSQGLTETDMYASWGLYNGYIGTANVTYKEAFLNSSHRMLLINHRNPDHNGSITAWGNRHRWCEEGDSKLAGWGHIYGLLHLALAYDLTTNTLWSNLFSKMLWDYVYEAQTNDGSITFYRHAIGSYAHYNNRQYTPTSASVVASIWWYYKNVAEPSTTSGAYVVDGSEKITSISHTSETLTFTVNAPSGKTSTTEVYCGSKGEPTSVTGATLWSYDSSTKILTITVIHSSTQQIIIDWTELAVPEFPVGAAVEIALAIVIIHSWSRSRRKTKKIQPDERLQVKASSRARTSTRFVVIYLFSTLSFLTYEP